MPRAPGFVRDAGGADRSVTVLRPILAQASSAPQQSAPRSQGEGLWGAATNFIVIPNCRLTTTTKEDVPSQRDGVLDFIGVELKEGEQPRPGEEVYEVKVDNTTKHYRLLKEGDRVEAGQLLAQVDDTLARADAAIKQAKLEAARADKDASDKTRDEAEQRYYTQQKLYNNNVRGSTSLEDLRGAKLTWDKYKSEAISKQEAIKVSQQELHQALKIVEMHQIKSKISGIVKIIYKHCGEAVRNAGPQDPVLQIQNFDVLHAEGMMDVQYLSAVKKGDTVIVEPTVREGARQTFSGHRLEITGVAVSKDPRKPLIVSSSDDGTIMVWQRSSGLPIRVLNNRSPVKAVACTPPGSDANLCLSGDLDGNARIWDLDSSEEKPIRELKDAHKGPIRCVAFSLDGKLCATGGEDSYIKLWDTATGSLLYRIPGESGAPGHRSSVTSLHFTPQGELISASTDKTVRFWKLSSVNAEEIETLQRRSIDVPQLGVSLDGKHVIDEQGAKEMRVLSWPGLRTEEILENTSQSSGFKTVALFSPDGRLLLTSSGTDGVFQLWRLDKRRSNELRLLVPGMRSEATCAAFSPDGSFVVGGIKDRKVYVWPTPTKEEIDRQILAKVINVEPLLEGVDNKVRIVAELANPADRPLVSGDLVTLVAIPER